MLLVYGVGAREQGNNMKSATVLTPTIGHDTLGKCIQSVDNQDYENLQHLVVIDGPEYFDAAMNETMISHEKSRTQFTVTPENTGGVFPGYYGHRIYAAYPHLLNSDYILFLDEDNWYDPNHVSSLIELCERKNYDWAFSLRNIYTKNEQFLDPDCCESIGLWPIYWSLGHEQNQFLVDTSSYCFRRDWLIKHCHHWHSGWGGDRRFFSIIKELCISKAFVSINPISYGTTGLHTLNYRLDDVPEKKYGSLDFFKKGNDIIRKHYGEYPWNRPVPSIQGKTFESIDAMKNDIIKIKQHYGE